MKKEITMVDVFIMWMVAFCIFGIMLFVQHVNSKSNNMTEYKGGQSECTQAYLNE